jgi:F0F1-type ATP synthase epsilon subunit
VGNLSIEIVTPYGTGMEDEDIDEVIIRRREDMHEQGSHVSILPRHGSMLVRIPDAPMKYFKNGDSYEIHLSDGFVEVKDDRIVFLVHSFERNRG